VSTYNNELQGQSGPGFAWVLFDGSAADAGTVSPRATSSAGFTFTDDDARRVRTCLSHVDIMILIITA